MAGVQKPNFNPFRRPADSCNCRERSAAAPSSNSRFRRIRARCTAWPKSSAPCAKRRLVCCSHFASSRSRMTTTAACGRRSITSPTAAGSENPRSSTCRGRSSGLSLYWSWSANHAATGFRDDAGDHHKFSRGDDRLRPHAGRNAGASETGAVARRSRRGKNHAGQGNRRCLRGGGRRRRHQSDLHAGA